jgi:hypothetical protein
LVRSERNTPYYYSRLGLRTKIGKFPSFPLNSSVEKKYHNSQNLAFVPSLGLLSKLCPSVKSKKYAGSENF